MLDRASPLAPGRVVRLRLDIGELSPESQVEDAKSFPFPEHLPKDVDLDVMVSSTDLAVATDPKGLARGRPTIAHGRFFLPGDGAATTPDGGKYLVFYLKTPNGPRWTDTAHARIGFYYRNILLQSQHLTVRPGKGGGFTIETDFTTSDDLTMLDRIPERPRISVLTNANDGGDHQLVLRRPGEEAAVDAETLAFTDTNIGKTIRRLREVLANRAPTEKQRGAAQLEQDLRQLAPIGRKLYAQLPGMTKASFLGRWKDTPESFVIHVARPKGPPSWRRGATSTTSPSRPA